MPRRKNWKISEARRAGVRHVQASDPVIVQGQSCSSPVIVQASDRSPVIVQASDTVIVQGQGECYNILPNDDCYITLPNDNCYKTSPNDDCYINIVQPESSVVSSNNKQYSEQRLCSPDVSECAKKPENKSIYFSFPTKSCMEADKTAVLDTFTYPLPCDSVVNEPLFVATPVFMENSSRPAGSDMFIQGSFHQGHSMFMEESRGRQCTVNALCSLIFAKFFHLNTKKDLDDILFHGDSLYKETVVQLQKMKKFKSMLLNFDELPDVVNIFNRRISVVKSDVISGVCTQKFVNMYLPSLFQSIEIALMRSSYLLVMTGAICSAVFKENDQYFFFDSHSHGSNGLSCENGTSILISFHMLEDLLSYMYAMYESMLIDTSGQFDILPISFMSRSFDHTIGKSKLDVASICDRDVKSIHCKDQTCIETDISQFEEWKIVSPKRKKKSVNYLLDVIESKEPSQHMNTENNVTLIGRYFNDQMQSNKDYMQRKAKMQTFDRKDYMKVYMQKRRKCVDFKRKDREYTLKSKSKARQSYEQREKDRELTLKSKSKARQSEEQREKDRELTFKSMSKARQSEEQREKDRELTRKSKSKARQSEEQREKDRELTRKSMSKARQSEEQREKHRELTFKSKSKARKSEEYRKKDRETTLKSKRKARKSEEFKQKELDIQNKSKRKARSDPYQKEKERITKQQYRSDQKHKEVEKLSDSKRKAAKRKDTCFNESEIVSRKHRKYGSDIDTCIQRFHEEISVGPIYICSCCTQTWFKQSVSEAKHIKSKISQKYLTGILSFDEKEWLCVTCKNSMSVGKVPKLAVFNGMKWPVKPKELDLYPLEERLIALRIPFMQMRELPRGRQLSVKGNVINVPVDIQPVVNALPRPFDENITIAVKLKKKMSFKSCVFSENVRPVRVLVALHWLMKSSDLYKNANIDIDQEWINSVTKDSCETLHEFFETQVKCYSGVDIVDFDGVIKEMFEDTHCDQSNEKILHEFFESQVKKNAKSCIADFGDGANEIFKTKINVKNMCEDNASQREEEIYDSDAEEGAHENVGNIDTLLDYADLENRNCTYTFAPREGQRPLSIYQDKDSEYLCFPSIFCGQRRKENDERCVPVHYSDVAKWELRSQDRRAANSVPNIFFKLKKIQMKQLNDKVQLALRRCQTDKNGMTAEQARNEECVEAIVKNDHGYYIFKQLRNSPAYLESRKKDVYAMIRQLGIPTWFISLSSADTQWRDLLKILSTLNENVNYTDEHIENLSWEQKIKLIQKDPVTCSRYFEHRVQQFITLVLKSEHLPLGKLTDYFYRVEFQQRGSPHIHMIVWIENAPKFHEDTNETIITFVDEFLQCSNTDEISADLIKLQCHNHSRTCRKKEDRICRFGFPLPPLPRTMILQPLEVDKKKYEKLYQKLQKKMNEQKGGYNFTFEEFLQSEAQMNEEEYIKCICSTLNNPKVFLKRRPCDIRVNLYNKNVLQAWRANIDIQFVLDPYACAMYIVSYISKSQRGMSNLLHAAAKEARNGNFNIKEQVRQIGNVFSNSVEVGAQEAVYLVLQMPLTRSTRDVVYINTSVPEKRIQLLKQKSVLDNLPANSKDIMSDNVIKRYSRRPKVLSNWCLADYVSQLDIIYPHENDGFDVDNDDDKCNEDENEDNEELDDLETVTVLRNGIKIKRRKKSKIIRYVRFNKKSDEENHCREKILLFFPWRDEEKDLMGNFSTYKQHYESMKRIIDMKCRDYEYNADDLDSARELAEADYDAYDDIAPSTQQAEGDDAEEGAVESQQFIYFNPDRIPEHREYDIGTEIGSYVSAPQVNVNEKILSDFEYRKLLQSLNSKQKQFYNHVVHWIKTKDAPLHVFLSGGAGVGKSLVIRALYQTLYRLLNLKEGECPDDTRILLCAYTGKAAFNINGSTISSAFKQKYKQSDQTLTSDSLNSFRAKYCKLSVVIIDEISMVSNSMLNFIDQRLQELKGTRSPFGGVSIIAVGDLYQLKPVSGDWIFNDLKHDAAALSRNLWKELFTMFDLTQIMRQKDDLEFAELLNRLRTNSLTDKDKARLKQCEVKSTDDNYDKNAPHLFAENYFMHVFNDEIIRNIATEKVEIPCNDTLISPKLSKQNQEDALKKIPTDSNKTANLHCSVTVVVNMIYDLTVNINTEDGLANGASGVVKFIEYKQRETNRPSIIWVQFDDLNAGMETRVRYKNRGLYHSRINDSWTPIFDTERSFTYNRKTFQRIQFPLQPSAGRSVHRAQGSTLERVVVDLSQRKCRKVPHLHYVALSRVRSIEKLQILNFNEESLTVDKQVLTEMQRLHNTASLKLCFISLESIDSTSHFKIAFNNCRSLHLHFDDIKQDHNLLSAHVFGLAETRLHGADNDSDFAIEGYHLIRNDQIESSADKRPPHGIAVYVRDNITVTKQKMYTSATLEFILITTYHPMIELQILFLYKSPHMPDNKLYSSLNEKLLPYLKLSQPLVIIGDFNINGFDKPRTILNRIGKTFSCKMLMNQSTTDYMSMLDLIFSNVAGVVGTCETYWSDHKIAYFYK